VTFGRSLWDRVRPDLAWYGGAALIMLSDLQFFTEGWFRIGVGIVIFLIGINLMQTQRKTR
jgi:hypothetical protein